MTNLIRVELGRVCSINHDEVNRKIKNIDISYDIIQEGGPPLTTNTAGWPSKGEFEVLPHRYHSETARRGARIR